jgi:hypothetical protein
MDQLLIMLIHSMERNPSAAKNHRFLFRESIPHCSVFPREGTVILALPIFP